MKLEYSKICIVIISGAGILGDYFLYVFYICQIFYSKHSSESNFYNQKITVKLSMIENQFS